MTQKKISLKDRLKYALIRHWIQKGTMELLIEYVMVPILIVSASGLAYRNWIEIPTKKEEAMERLAVLADANRNGITESEEWGEVYLRSGGTRLAYSTDPNEIFYRLSISELEIGVESFESERRRNLEEFYQTHLGSDFYF